MDPAKLKVVELRAELSARGLDTKGNKPVLVERLRDALNSEIGEDKDASTGDASDEEVSSRESEPEPEETIPSRRSRARRNRSPSPKPILTPSKKSTKRTVSFEEPKIQEVEESSESAESDSELITGDCLPTPVFQKNIATSESESENEEIITSNKVPAEKIYKSESKSITDETQTVIQEPKTVSSPKKLTPEPTKTVIAKINAEKVEQSTKNEVEKVTMKSPQIKSQSEKVSISEKNIAKSHITSDDIKSPKSQVQVTDTLKANVEFPKPKEETAKPNVETIKDRVATPEAKAEALKSKLESPKIKVTSPEEPKVKIEPTTDIVSEIKTSSITKKKQEPVITPKVESSAEEIQQPKQTVEVISVKAMENIKTSPKKHSKNDLTEVPVTKDIIKMDVDPVLASSIEDCQKVHKDEINENKISTESSEHIEIEKDVNTTENVAETVDEKMDTSEDASEKMDLKTINDSVETPTESKENIDDIAEAAERDSSRDRRAARKNKKSRWGNFTEPIPESNTEDIVCIAEEIPKATEDPPMRDEKRGQKRKRSISPANMENAYNAEPQEDEPEYDDENVLLSWFDSDLYLQIDPTNFTTAKPIYSGTFEHAWAGVRASYGVSEGKVCFEVKLLDNIKLHEKHNIDPHAIRLGWSINDYNLQLGETPFSYGYESLGNSCCNKEFKKYGESFTTNDVIGVYLDLESSPCKISYTVNGVSQGNAFEFEKSDLQDKALFPHILTKNISFKVNFGQEPKSLLNKPKLKKVLKKNISKIEKSDVSDDVDNAKKNDSKDIPTKSQENAIDNKMESSDNLEEKKEVVDNMEICEDKQENPEKVDQIEKDVSDNSKDDIKNNDNVENKVEELKEEYEYIEEEDEEAIGLSILEGYEYIGKLSLDNRVSGPKRPDSKTECEVFMLCGLPGVGKTYWATEWSTQRPEKRYNILGAHSLVNRMTISGECKKSNYAGDWNSLIESCSKAVTPLLNIACKRRRNYIIDQTNIYPAVRDKKIRPFVGFVRKAIVIIPSEENWTKRKAEQDKTFSKQINDSSLLSMKAGFVLPEEDNIFAQVIYTDLSESDARILVQKYNNEGKEAGYNMKPKRFRFDSYDSDRNERGSRNDRGDRFNRNNRFNDRRNVDDRRNFNRRGGNERFDRQDRGGQRWGNNPRFGGPPPPQGGWGGGGRNNQWGGRGGGGGGGRHPGNWRGGPPPPPPPHRGGDHRGDMRHERGDRSDHRGGDRGLERGDFNRGGRGGFGNRNANWNNRGGGDRRTGGSGGGSGHQGRGGSGGRQGQVGNTNNSNWVNPNKPSREKSNEPDIQASSNQSTSGAGGGGGSGNWQNWNNNSQQNWGQQQQQQWGQGHQNWNQGQQNWNQNWNQQQQGWQNQQNWGGGWKGYGQWGQQYWGQWNQGQTTGTGTAGTSTTTTTTASTNAITTTSSTPSTTTNATANSYSAQYSTSYPGMQQYQSGQYSAGANTTAGANQSMSQAQMYQNWAQYAQAYANYGQQQQQTAAAGAAGSGNSTEEKKKK